MKRQGDRGCQSWPQGQNGSGSQGLKAKILKQLIWHQSGSKMGFSSLAGNGPKVGFGINVVRKWPRNQVWTHFSVPCPAKDTETYMFDPLVFQINCLTICALRGPMHRCITKALRPDMAPLKGSSREGAFKAHRLRCLVRHIARFGAIAICNSDRESRKSPAITDSVAGFRRGPNH